MASKEVAELSIGLSLDTGNTSRDINNINKVIRNTEKDFKSAGKGVENFEKTFTGLDAKIQKTSKQIDLYNLKLDKQKEAYDKLKGTLDKQVAELEKIENTLGKGSKEWEKQAELVQKNSIKLNKLGTDINDTTSTISKLENELAESQKSFNELGNETATLEDKLEQLNKEILEEQKEWDKLSQEIEESGKKFKNLDTTLNHMKNQMEFLQRAANLLETEISSLNSELNRNEQEYKQLSQEIQRTENELQQAKSEFGESSQEAQQLSTKLNGLKDDYMRVGKEIDSTKQDLSQLNNELKDTKQDMNKLSQEIREMPWDAIQKDLETTKQKYEDLADKTEGLTTKLAVVGGAGTAAFIQASDATSHFKGALGVTNEEAEKLTERAKELNHKGFDFSEAVEAITLVDQTMSELLKPDEIQGFTQDALSLAKTFEVDVNDVVKASSLMMKNFGIDGKQATDIITKGFQNGLNVSGDWIDTLWEYSVQFSDLGFSADETFSIINKGMELGIFNTDKLADMVKESNIRLKEMGKAQVEGVKDLGLSTTTVQKNIAAGGETAAKQMAEVAQKVLEVKDPVEQNAIAVAIFGTMFEDLGLDGVRAIASVKDAQVDLKGSTDEMSQSLEESLGMQLRGKLAELKEPLMRIGEAMIPIIDSAIELTSQFAEWFSSLDQGTIDVLVGFGLMVAGISPIMKVLANTTTVTQFLTSNLGKLGADAVGTGGKFGIFGASATTLSSVALPLVVLALAKIMDSVGDSETSILGLQDHFGSFGVFLGGICEFISGVWDLTIGTIATGATLIMDLIAAAIDGPGGFTVKEAWQKFNDDMNQKHMDAMSKLSLNTTQGMSQLRNATDVELNNVLTIYDSVLGQIPNITSGKMDMASTQLASKLQGMSNTELTILQGMNDQTKWMFDGIKAGMNIDQITQQLTNNFEKGKMAGLTNTKSLEEGVKNGMDLTKQHMGNKTKEGAAAVDKNTKDANSKAKSNADKTAQDVGNAYNKVADNAKQGSSKVAQNTDDDFKKANRSVQQSATDMYNGSKNSYSKMADVARSEGTRMYNGVSTSAERMAQKAKSAASDMYRGVTTSARLMANSVIGDWNRISSALSRSITGNVKVVKTTVSKTEKAQPRLRSIPTMLMSSEPMLLRDIPTVKLPDITPYNLNDGYYNSATNKSKSLLSPKNNSNSKLEETLAEQNELLYKLIDILASGENKKFEIPIIVDGRELARSVAQYKGEIDEYDSRNASFAYR